MKNLIRFALTIPVACENRDDEMVYQYRTGEGRGDDLGHDAHEVTHDTGDQEHGGESRHGRQIGCDHGNAYFIDARLGGHNRRFPPVRYGDECSRPR